MPSAVIEPNAFAAIACFVLTEVVGLVASVPASAVACNAKLGAKVGLQATSFPSVTIKDELRAIMGLVRVSAAVLTTKPAVASRLGNVFKPVSTCAIRAVDTKWMSEMARVSRFAPVGGTIRAASLAKTSRPCA